MADHEKHFYFLMKAFSDERYITVDGRPIFFIYEPDNIPDIKAMVDLWREMANKEGLKGLHLVGISHFSPLWDPRNHGLDACMMQKLPPQNGRVPIRFIDAKLKVLAGRGIHALSIYQYEEMVDFLLRNVKSDFLDYPCVLPNWDNTPRAGLSGLVFHESKPELFRILLKKAIANVYDYSPDHRIVMLKAWNEWAEGNYVEPDQKFGKGYLDVIRQEINKPELSHICAE